MVNSEIHESTDVLPFNVKVTKYSLTWIEVAELVDHIAFIVVVSAFVITCLVLIGIALGKIRITTSILKLL